MPLIPTTILQKRYQILELLGEGVYGAVYRAWDQKEEQEVAVKEFLAGNDQIHALFRQTAQKLIQLKHPQLPSFFDYFILEETKFYLISQYISGVSLQKLLDDYGPLPSDLLISWLQQIAPPLNYLHQQNQLHLNIKPANIRLTPQGKIFLVDTGLFELGLQPGNPGFAPPEQQKQTAVSPQSDIYQLGATLHTLLTNQIPPDALRRESLLESLKGARELNPNVEPYLSVMAMRALDLNPEVRFQTATEFAQALDRPAGRPPIQLNDARRSPSRFATPPPALRRFGKSWKQIEMRTIWGTFLLLIIALTIGFGIASFNRTQLLGGSEAAATATIESQIISALTQIAPTETPIPPPTETPFPTPAPISDEKTEMLMHYMPGGPFRMGNDNGDRSEQPSHLVRVDPYYIDETEVSTGQYQKCVAEAVCRQPENLNGTYHDAYFGDERFDNYPVIFVSWYDAQTFCEWRGARLPSEAEWEKAASFHPIQFLRTTYPWGDQWDGQKTNYCDKNCPSSKRDPIFDDQFLDTAPVDSFANGRSAIGLYNMSGNVMEWVADWYSPRYYETAPMSNPLGPLEGDAKTIRGGSWFSISEELTTSWRSSYEPTVTRATVGFRCALTAP